MLPKCIGHVQFKRQTVYRGLRGELREVCEIRQIEGKQDRRVDDREIRERCMGDIQFSKNTRKPGLNLKKETIQS
jgi:hypothetical protein